MKFNKDFFFSHPLQVHTPWEGRERQEERRKNNKCDRWCSMERRGRDRWKRVSEYGCDWNIWIEDNSSLNITNLLWQHQLNCVHKWGFYAFHPATPFHDHMMVEDPQLASRQSSVTSMIWHLCHMLHIIIETARSTD